MYYLFAFPSRGIPKDGRYEVANILRSWKDSGYTLATTEAGLLPYYSLWQSLDTWGLNDHKIATEGVITQAYLTTFSPDLVMFDAFSDQGDHLHGNTWSSYGDMMILCMHI